MWGKVFNWSERSACNSEANFGIHYFHCNLTEPEYNLTEQEYNLTEQEYNLTESEYNLTEPHCSWNSRKGCRRGLKS